MGEKKPKRTQGDEAGEEMSSPCVIHLLFEQWAARQPDAVAVEGPGGCLSYAEVNRRADNLAARLAAEGVKAETPVGICMERCVETVVAAFGVMKAGGVYVPLDRAHPRERIDFSVEDTAMPVIITQSVLKEKLSTTPAKLICIDDALCDADYPALAPRNAGAADTAYIIYTSGSTGKPKGVRCHHGGVLNMFDAYQAAQPIGPGDNGSWWASFCFDVSVYEIFAPLVAGATLKIAPEEIRSDTMAYMDWLAAEKITNAFLMPMMVPDLEAWIRKNPGGSSLRRLKVGVEPIPEKSLNAIAAAVPGLRLFNSYGPTEASITATIYPIDPEREPHKNAPIGRAIKNTQIYILDENLQPVADGEPGGICIAGKGVSHGYLNRPELNAEKFIDCPWTEGKMYRTGDIGVRLPDGNIMFRGRVDFQVKFRGYRVELGEIETAIRQLPGIRECVVLMREDVPGDKRLVAYTVSKKPSGQMPAGEIKARLAKLLPDYMVPSIFIALGKVPLTPHGKTDRRALPAPSPADILALRAAEYAAPRTETEKAVAEIFEEVLGIERAGRNDNFFELGGHSLIATQICSRLASALSVQVPLHTLYDAPTVELLSTEIERTDSGARVERFQALEKRDTFPATFAQEGMWFVQQLDDEGILFNIPHVTRFYGEPDPAALERALNRVVARHESLRTVFCLESGAIIQKPQAELKLELPIVDLSLLPDDERENEFTTLATKEGRTKVNFETGPLLRAVAVKFSNEHWRLVFTIHHIIIDGWGIGIFLKELATLYETPQMKLPVPEVQYGDFAVWQRQQSETPAMRQELEYWKAKLDGFQTLELPADRPRPDIG